MGKRSISGALNTRLATMPTSIAKGLTALVLAAMTRNAQGIAGMPTVFRCRFD